MKKVVFLVDGQKVKGTLIFPKVVKQQSPGALFIHGWTSSEESYLPRAKAVAKHGEICLIFNLRGHGKSDGRLEDFSRKDHLKDVITAYDFLVGQKSVDKNRIGVCGSSYGGYLASILTSKRKVKWLVLRAPALYPDEDFNIPTAKLIREEINTYRRTKISPKENLALKAASKFSGNLLLVESEKDETVPRETIKNYLKAVNPKATLDHKIMKNADHALTKKKWKLEFIKILSEWYNRITRISN